MKILPKEKVNLGLVIGYLLFYILKVTQTYLDFMKCKIKGKVINFTSLWNSISYRAGFIVLELILFIAGILYIYRDTENKRKDNIKASILLIIGLLLTFYEVNILK